MYTLTKLYMRLATHISYPSLFRLFGDEHELSFWTIALHYLRAEKADPNSKVSVYFHILTTKQR